jgi:DNA replication protein DnaC
LPAQASDRSAWDQQLTATGALSKKSEMGYLNLRPEQTNIFFKLMEERYRRFPTIITTNLDYEEWHNFLGNNGLVTALLSRLRHQCHTVKIDGPSLRDPQS